jgi:tripartite-type tricarboxylate transporter receptor subunit TctC
MGGNDDFETRSVFCCRRHARCGAGRKPSHCPEISHTTIKIIVPGTPGGPTDVMARLISRRLQTGIGQCVIIENRAGGGGTLAAKAGASLSATTAIGYADKIS